MAKANEELINLLRAASTTDSAEYLVNLCNTAAHALELKVSIIYVQDETAPTQDEVGEEWTIQNARDKLAAMTGVNDVMRSKPDGEKT